MPKPYSLSLLAAILALTAAACAFSSASGSLPSATLPPTALPTLPATPTQWPTPVNQEWRTIAVGVERRDIPVHEPHFRFPASVQLVRLDPSLVKIHTHYSPDVPITIEQWQTETQAMMVINGGFFTAAKRMDGLMVSFGFAYGRSFSEGGMFFIRQGEASIRDLSIDPYVVGEETDFDEAMQAYPVLVYEGRAAHDFNDERYNRRTAVAIDEQGRIIFMVIDQPTVSLYELSRWLPRASLDIESALNLDGGSSTGMAIETEQESLLVNSKGPLPIVFGIYP